MRHTHGGGVICCCCYIALGRERTYTLTLYTISTHCYIKGVRKKLACGKLSEWFYIQNWNNKCKPESVIIFLMVYCSCYRGQWSREMREIPRVRDFPTLGEASRSIEKPHSAPLVATLVPDTLISLYFQL